MKKYKSLVFALAGLLSLAACEDDDLVPGNPVINPTTQIGAAMFGDSLAFSAEVADNDVPLSTLKAQLFYGDEKVSGAGSTMGGLSMLMGAASVPLKDMVKQFDDNVTSPFITAMYRWNMQWSENQVVKGDYDVKATGSTSLIAKEVRAQQYQTVFGITADPRYQGRVKDDELLESFFRDVDMPTHLIRTPQEYQQYQQEQMQMQAKAQTDALVQSLMEQALAQGIDAQSAFSSIVAKLGAMPQQQQGEGQQS